MVLFSKFLTSTDSGSFLCVRTQNLGTYLSTELHSWKALPKSSIPSFLQPGTAVVLSRGVCWNPKAGSGDRVCCCVAFMNLDVQTCHLLCDIMHLLHSIHFGWNYPWKIHAFLAEDDDASDTVGVKYRRKIVKEALCLLNLWLGSKSLQPCDSSELWIRPHIFFLVYMYIDNTSISFLIILYFFHKLQSTGNVPVPSTKQ